MQQPVKPFEPRPSHPHRSPRYATRAVVERSAYADAPRNRDAVLRAGVEVGYDGLEFEL